MTRTLKDLEERAKRQREAQRERLHKRYHMARELGFSSEEAAILQHWRESDIRSLAYEKGLIEL